MNCGDQNVSAPQLVVMAAGLGSRYGGLKQVEPIGPAGELLLEYAVFDAIRAGFARVVFVVRQDIEEDFRRHVGRNIESRIDTVYVHQKQDQYLLPGGERVAVDLPAGRKKPWGTAQAVLSAAHAITGPFAVINADDYYGSTSFETLATFLAEESADHCLIGYPLIKTLSDHGHVARGVCDVNADGLLAGVVERTRVGNFRQGIGCLLDNDIWHPLPATTIVSMNMWGFRLPIFNELAEAFSRFLDARGGEEKSECHLPAVIADLLETRAVRVRVLPTCERWYGVTWRGDRAALQTALAELAASGRYPVPLWG
ncbi:MAG: NTP transferase domain-containing protein [bacterium]|nr:NTP transferase domain-containing protein [bacterium]